MNMQVASKPGSPESLQPLVEMIRNPSASLAVLSSATVGKEDKARQSRDKKVCSSMVLLLFIFMLIFLT